MIVCKELDKTFENKEELFKALKENKKDIIGLKKSQVHKSFEKGLGINLSKCDMSKLAASKSEFSDDNYHYIATNTTKILDSHSDLHVNGIWNKSAKEQNRKNSLLDSHIPTLKTTIARRKNVEIFVSDIPFRAVGKDYNGSTQALVYKINKDKIREEYKEWFDDDSDIEASVKMQYVDIDLAMNSTAKGDESELKEYNDNIDSIANKDDLGEILYFWTVKQAKNLDESSLVLNGSNPATGIVDNSQPSGDTGKNEPPAGTHDNDSNKELLEFYNNLK